MYETDILVVGGGPAGSTVAKYLSLGGMKNILIQRNFDFRKPCGGGIRADAFERFDIDKSLIKKNVNTFALVTKSKRIEVDISKTPIAIVDRVEFDTALRNKAKECGTHLIEATFVSLELFDEYIISVIKEGDTYLKVKSQYIIAADGVNSKLRKLITQHEVPSSLTHYADITSKHYNACEFYFGKSIAKNHYAWAFPHADGSNIGTIVDSSCFNSFKQQLNIEEDVKSLGYKIPLYKDNVFYKNRVYFVGDSASHVLPFTYEGIYYAMNSAKILADVIIEKEDSIAYENRWNQKYKAKFDLLLKLQMLFLYNDFTIWIMMRLMRSKRAQNQLVDLWLGEKLIVIDKTFFYKVIKRIFLR